ncbi:toxin Tbo-IT2-like isoform X7 [Macrobrachium nipponense]|uniref:toxin Tbo-IT2-like isoform X7 n=1 Tax=Macrobrachium nipponense TaxID=159736 RepID=UPI0030C800A3
MGSKVLVMVLAFSLVLSIAMAQPLVEDEPFYILDHEEDAPPPEADYTTDLLERLLARTAQKRSCIPRGGACTHRPQACCNSSSCRCNLWGTNCRCQRMGLFQQLGK